MSVGAQWRLATSEELLKRRLIVSSKDFLFAFALLVLSYRFGAYSDPNFEIQMGRTWGETLASLHWLIIGACFFALFKHNRRSKKIRLRDPTPVVCLSCGEETMHSGILTMQPAPCPECSEPGCYSKETLVRQ